MPKLLDNRVIGLTVADVATRSYAGVPPGSVLQVAPDGQSLILGPVAVGPGTAITGPTGAGVGATGATGPAGPATVQAVGLRYIFYTTPGNFAWLVPNNVTHVVVNAVAGGGGGSAGTPGGTDFADGAGSAGQAGGNLRVTVGVTPGSIITGVIGTGGLGESLSAGSGSQTAGTATTVGGIISVNDVLGINNIVCNGGSAGGLFVPGSGRASTSPQGPISPFLSEYGLGGAGAPNYSDGFNGRSGAVLIEWVSVS